MKFEMVMMMMEMGLVDDLVFWNGFFGKGVFNADLEAYFVFDDDPDEEWDFYPRSVGYHTSWTRT